LAGDNDDDDDDGRVNFNVALSPKTTRTPNNNTPSTRGSTGEAHMKQP